MGEVHSYFQKLKKIIMLPLHVHLPALFLLFDAGVLHTWSFRISDQKPPFLKVTYDVILSYQSFGQYFPHPTPVPPPPQCFLPCVSQRTFERCVQRTLKQKVSRTFQSFFYWLLPAPLPLVLLYLFCKSWFVWGFFSDFFTPLQNDLQVLSSRRVLFALFHQPSPWY